MDKRKKRQADIEIIKNVRQYKGLIPPTLGEKRNPKGINQWTSQKALVQQVALQVLGEEIEVTIDGIVKNITRWEAVFRAVVERAMRGDVTAAVYVRDTAFGRPSQVVEFQGSMPVQLTSLPDILVASQNGKIPVKSDSAGDATDGAKSA